jgi:8-oxo-dGTP pyrophosphatase MutT (NUDIX family)
MSDDEWHRPSVRGEVAPIPSASLVLVRAPREGRDALAAHGARDANEAVGGLEAHEELGARGATRDGSLARVAEGTVLLLRRNPALSFHGGAWVFPGGRCDPGETPRTAAVRETLEESGLVVSPDAIERFARWTTPEGRPKRFVTDLFVAWAPDGEVRVDGGEIVEARWWTPREALRARDAGELVLPPPTFVTLARLANGTLAPGRVRGVDEILPVVVAVERGSCALYPGDAGYASADPSAVGARHRAWLLDGGWRYERS